MKLKDWLLKKYLPSWAVLEYGDALAAAQKRVRELEFVNPVQSIIIYGVPSGYPIPTQDNCELSKIKASFSNIVSVILQPSYSP